MKRIRSDEECFTENGYDFWFDDVIINNIDIDTLTFTDQILIIKAFAVFTYMVNEELKN